MRRTRAALLIGAMVVGAAFVVPAANAAPARAPSTTCSFTFNGTFDSPGLLQGMNRGAFFGWDVTLDECVGGRVSSATGYGGTKGDLECDAGQILGVSSAKMQLYWDTGGSSGVNFHIDFTRSRYGGRVLAGHFRGERMRALHFTFTPTKGDCGSVPLTEATITGTVSL